MFWRHIESFIKAWPTNFILSNLRVEQILMAQIGLDFCVHSFLSLACTLSTYIHTYIHTCMYNIMFPVYLYSLYIHESSLSTWHDFIWTLCIKRNDLFVCISWGIVSLPIRKSWFLSPVDSEYIHYFVHVAANIFWLTGLYRFILCIVAAFYSKDWMPHDILCNILDICFMLISFDNVLAIFVSCVC